MSDSGTMNTILIILGVLFCLVFPILMALTGWAASAIFRSKGRSPGGGFALGFFLGLIGVLIAAFLSPAGTAPASKPISKPVSRSVSPQPPPKAKVQAPRVLMEKDNLGTLYDTFSRGSAFWNTRMIQGPFNPFVIAYFNNLENARKALLELPCIHAAQDTNRLISTQILDFGYYQKPTGEVAGFISGQDLTHDLWVKARDAFTRHGGEIANEEEPEDKPAPVAQSAIPHPEKVVFVREDISTGQMGETVVKRYYQAPDAASAQAFLQQNPVTKNFFYLIVDTPDGKYCRDIQGFYR